MNKMFALRLFSGLTLVALLAACVAPQAVAPAAVPTEAATEAAAPAAAEAMSAEMQALVDAAKAEGTLSTIALPRDWCNYGEVIDTFKAKYGLEVNELNPDAGSGDEVEAIKANKDNKGPQAPDVIDVGFAFGPQAVADKLVTPYKVATWDSIPADVKDADGNWYGDYYGVLSFMVNKDVVKTTPADWKDLLNDEYKGQVSLSGDPRVSNQSIQTVIAAGLGNGGTLDDAADKGLAFFAEVNTKGNLLPTTSSNALFAKGETPIRIAWDYLNLAAMDGFAGNPPAELGSDA